MYQWRNRDSVWLVVLAVACLSPRSGAAARAPWHHSASPFRAEFEMTAAPSQPEAGTAVSVPVCGLGRTDGSGLVAFDEGGNQLALLPLGESVENCAIALVRLRPDAGRVYLYFGSKRKAPVNRRAFLPGLTADVRSLPEGPFDRWEQVEQLLGKSRRLGRIFVDRIALSHNPVDSSDSCIVVFQGFLRVPKSGSQSFMLVSDDAGYLFIDEELLISRDGRHYARDALRGESRAQVELSAGPHPLRCVVVDLGGELMAVVARWIDGHHKYALKPEDFLQPGKTRLVGVEARYRDAPNPAFWYRRKSYMSYNDVPYTEVEFGTYNKGEAAWRFADGAELEGATVSKIFVGLATRDMRVSQGRATATGTVTFPEDPPPQLRLGNLVHFKHYTALMLNQKPARLQLSTLQGCVSFLQYRELNEDAIPFHKAILSKAEANAGVRKAALVGLARASAGNFPDQADRAYKELVRDFARAPDWPDLAREYAEFLLFRQRDFETAEAFLGHLAKALGRSDKRVAALKLDLALQQGRVDQARTHLNETLSGRDLGKQQRYAVVKGNVLRERLYDLLKNDFLLEARETYWEWADLAPSDRLDGSLSLARARLFKAYGWHDGALGELDGAILLDPLLPNLPDVELERAVVYQEAGEMKRGNEILLRIVNEYPKHPAAAKAKELVK